MFPEPGSQYPTLGAQYLVSGMVQNPCQSKKREKKLYICKIFSTFAGKLDRLGKNETKNSHHSRR